MEQLFYNGEILTMEREDAVFEALLVRDGLVVCTGTLPEVGAAAASDAQQIDLAGHCVMPAFIDAHSHLVMSAQFSAMADLSGCRDEVEIQAVLDGFIRQKGLTKQDGLMGVGYDHNFFTGKRHPDKAALDEVGKGIPIYISHTTSHMGVANTAALELAGITPDTPDPPGGRYGRNPDGSLTGYVEEIGAVSRLMLSIAPRLNLDLKKLMCEAQSLYLKNGITTCQDGAAGTGNVALLQAMAKEKALKLDVVAYLMMEAKLPEEMRPGEAGRYENRFKIGGLKLILDGSPQSKTAWLTKPYAGTSETGKPAMDDNTVEAACVLAVDGGYQLLAHCNGDAAADQFLRCYRRAVAASDRPDKKRLRPVMIHSQTVRQDQLDDMAALGVIPSIFVAHTYYWGDVHLENLGQIRGAQISPARSALDRGLRVTFHQDTPVLKPDMLDAIWCAVNRETISGAAIGKEEAVTVFDALRAVTANAAYAYFEEDTKGLLKEGYLADLVVLSENPLRVDPRRLREIRVLETMKEGTSVFKA